MLKIKVGNGVWWTLMGGTALGALGLFAWLSGCDADRARRVLLMLGGLTLALYVVQRAFMFRDPDFLAEYGSRWQDKLVQFLPLHLCYAGLLLTMAGLLWNVELLMAFGFCICTPGATMAMVAPDGYNQNKSILLPHILLFYVLHGMLVCVYCNIGLLGLFEPGWRMALRVVALTLALAVVIHGVNVLGQKAGLQAMNYFYTMDPGGSGLLEKMWTWIPCRFFYIVVPALGAFAAWTLLMMAVKLAIR